MHIVFQSTPVTLIHTENAQFLLKTIIMNVKILYFLASGYSVLHRAASWGHLDCVKMLVNYGIDMQIMNVHGERAREAAARYGKQDCVDFLDRAGILDCFINS
jgi:hypothetical protein